MATTDEEGLMEDNQSNFQASAAFQNSERGGSCMFWVDMFVEAKTDLCSLRRQILAINRGH